jgi:hypothetical protein
MGISNKGKPSWKGGISGTGPHGAVGRVGKLARSSRSSVHVEASDPKVGTDNATVNLSGWHARGGKGCHRKRGELRTGVLDMYRTVGHRVAARRMREVSATLLVCISESQFHRAALKTLATAPKLQQSAAGALRAPHLQRRRANQGTTLREAQPPVRSRPWADRPIWAGWPGLSHPSCADMEGV